MLLPYDPKAIVSLREKKEWSQARLAREAGISQPSLWSLERGDTMSPKVATLKSIADALGVPLDAILVKRAKGKGSEELDASVIAAYEALSDANKSTLYAVAQSLLAQQKGRK